MKIFHLITSIDKGGAETHLYSLIKKQVENKPLVRSSCPFGGFSIAFLILGFTSSGGSSWQSTDALHCRVKGIPDITYVPYESGDVNLDETIVFAVNICILLDVKNHL